VIVTDLTVDIVGCWHSNSHELNPVYYMTCRVMQNGFIRSQQWTWM